MANPPPSLKRRDFLIDIEGKVQQIWKSKKPYESEVREAQEKYFVTFPYPYMNGRLHIGHAFSLSKAEFQARYQRLKGRNVLFPFGFHVTGTPIAACADRLKREIADASVVSANETDASSPLLPSESPHESLDDGEAEQVQFAKTDVTKFSGKKSKAVSKNSQGTQWDIMLKNAIPAEEIPKFADSDYWLTYFPKCCLSDLENLGLAVDWRRSFLTTDANPYYDSFIRWQFLRLKERGKIRFGMRPAVFSQFDNQPCADHDRTSGEGVVPQEYTAIKMEVQTIPQAWRGFVGEGKRVYLVAATLRPETMYGQTNCFVLPEGKYGLFLAFSTPKKTFESEEEADRCDGILQYKMTREEALKKCDSIYVCSLKSALNMAFQGILPLEDAGASKAKMKGNKKMLANPHRLAKVTGQDLIGLPLSAPNALFPTVYALPMLNISMDKGTGVVTSVPSDAPDDYVALRDLKDKPKFREKFGVKEEWVNFDVVEIIDIPGLGKQAAVDVCIAKKIQSQNDTHKLHEAKEEVYKKGFYEGILIVGKYKGVKVSEAKTIVRDDLISTNEAFLYSEPERRVISRSGFDCIVASCNQWYIDYGEANWSKMVESHITSLNFSAFSSRCLNQLKNVVSWLGPWACSRSYGLGTQLPWEEARGKRVIIESLSDSTIYMAYYTIAHLLHSDIRGSSTGPLNITPQQLTNEVFDYIFAQSDSLPSNSQISHTNLNRLRHEFLYWYPVNLRVSGKDLIFNHLTMSLYNHAAIWPSKPNLWPRSYFCNGHVLVNGEKMSKSSGNFVSLHQAISDFSSDATRLSLADAGDTLDDANFQMDTANSSIMRLFLLHQFVEDFLTEKANMRTGAKTSADIFFDNCLLGLTWETKEAYERGAFRDGLKHCFYDFSLARDFYRLMSGGSWQSMHRDSVLSFIKTQVKILCPLAPHMCEWVWSKMLNEATLIVNELWPEWPTKFDVVLQRKYDLLQSSLDNFRKSRDKCQQQGKGCKGGQKKEADTSVSGKAPKSDGLKCAVIYVAKEYKPWQQLLLKELQKVPLNESGNEPLDSSYMVHIKNLPELTSWDKKLAKEALSFASFQMKHEVASRGAAALELSLPFDEAQLFEEHKDFIKRSLELDEISVCPANVAFSEDKTDRREMALPSKPSAVFFSRSL